MQQSKIKNPAVTIGVIKYFIKLRNYFLGESGFAVPGIGAVVLAGAGAADFAGAVTPFNKSSLAEDLLASLGIKAGDTRQSTPTIAANIRYLFQVHQ